MRFVCLFFLLSCSLAHAEGPPACGNDDIKFELLTRHFSNPRADFIDALLNNEKTKEKALALRDKWQGTVENVRQQAYDAGSRSRVCVADLTTTGGPDPSMNLLLIAQSPALCLDNSLEYIVQMTEDAGKTYLLSRCTFPPAALTIKGVVQEELEGDGR